MPLARVLKEVTHREYRLWMVWLEQDQDRTTPDQYYLMQIAQEVRRVLSRNKKSIKLRDFRIRFTRKKTKPKTQRDKDEATKLSRARWFSFLGMKGSKDYG